jgi:transcription elongation factor Elf1
MKSKSGNAFKCAYCNGNTDVNKVTSHDIASLSVCKSCKAVGVTDKTKKTDWYPNVAYAGLRLGTLTVKREFVI